QKLRLRPLICDATEVSTAAGPRLANTLVDTECATKPLGLHPRATQIEDVVVRHSPGPFACHGGGGGSLSQDGDWWREGPPPQDREPAGGLGKSSLEETFASQRGRGLRGRSRPCAREAQLPQQAARVRGPRPPPAKPQRTSKGALPRVLKDTQQARRTLEHPPRTDLDLAPRSDGTRDGMATFCGGLRGPPARHAKPGDEGVPARSCAGRLRANVGAGDPVFSASPTLEGIPLAGGLRNLAARTRGRKRGGRLLRRRLLLRRRGPSIYTWGPRLL
ncbi:unnamed protein product, partial [Prorocentrum cordatum]